MCPIGSNCVNFREISCLFSFGVKRIEKRARVTFLENQEDVTRLSAFDSLRNVFLFLFLHLRTGAHMHCLGAKSCMCAPRAVFVVVMDHRGGGCVQLSGIALILLSDY